MSEQGIERLEVRLGRLLTFGSTVSTVTLAVGVVAWLVARDSAIVGPIVNVGLLILMATPIARVAVSVAGFAWQREWRYVLMTMAVLATLAGSILVALRGGR